MKKQPFLPAGDLDREKWLLNFDTEFAGMAINLGFTAAEATAVHNDYLSFSYVLGANAVLKHELQERNKFKDLLADGNIGSAMNAFPAMPTLAAAPTAVPVAGIFKRMSKVVQRIKNHPNYNEAIGKNLGIIGAEHVVDFGNIKAEGQVKSVNADRIALSFTKGQTDGVVVYDGVPSQAVADAALRTPDFNWVEIGRAKISPFVDTRPNKTHSPETRYYKMRHIKNDQFVGNDSDIIRVVAEIYQTNTATDTTNTQR